MEWSKEALSAGMLLSGSVMDIRCMRLPVWFLAMCGALCAGVVIICGGNWQQSFMGIIPGAVVLLASRASGGSIGVADGIMVVFLGVIYGIEGVLVIFFLAIFAAGISAIFLLGVRHERKNVRIPFYPYLLLGFMVFYAGRLLQYG